MLSQLLEKLGITDYSKLTAEERATYQEWAAILTTATVTLDDVTKFLRAESKRADVELKKLDNTKEREIFYKVLCHLTDTLIAFIETPAERRDALREHLKRTFKVEI